jgi:ubiquinone biosynthesis protein UbiJ
MKKGKQPQGLKLATMARQIAKLIREIARLQGRIESLEADRRDDWYL